jgi:hypothetical protein
MRTTVRILSKIGWTVLEEESYHGESFCQIWRTVLNLSN